MAAERGKWCFGGRETYTIRAKTGREAFPTAGEDAEPRRAHGGIRGRAAASPMLGGLPEQMPLNPTRWGLEGTHRVGFG